MIGRTLWSCAFTFLVAHGATPVLAADDPANSPLRSSTSCETAPGQGRIRCEADVRTDDAVGAIEWADLQIIAVPSFLEPLKGRISPVEASRRGANLWHFEFALIARDRGDGDVVVRIRAVVCKGRSCRPEQVLTHVRVRVG